MDEKVTYPCNCITIAQRNLAVAEGMPNGEEKNKKIDTAIFYIELAYRFLMKNI